MPPRSRNPSAEYNPEDIARLVEAQVAAREAADEQAAQLARQNRVEARKAQYVEDLKSEVGQQIVQIRELTEVIKEQSKRVDRIFNSETFLDLSMLAATVGESNKVTQRLLDHVIDVQNLILELLRFILTNIKVNGDKARLTEAIRSLPAHPSMAEDARPEVEHVKKLLSLQHRTLQMLEEEAAQHSIDVPVATRHGIEGAQRRIGELQEQLMELLEKD